MDFRCIYRGPNSFETGFGVRSYHCYHVDKKHEKCIISPHDQLHDISVCSQCELRVAERLPISFEQHWTYISTKQLVADSLSLASAVPANCSGIVGIARSGLAPATILAMHLQLPLYELSIYNGVDFKLIKGGVRISDHRKCDGPLFVVDDTVHEGSCITLAKEIMYNKDSIFSAVYVRPDRKHLVDYYIKEIPSPHFMEWNIFNSHFVQGIEFDDAYRGGIAFDFDGVLCHDPPPYADRSPTLDWLINAKPTCWLPRRGRIPLILTLRLENWRQESEKWLRRHGILFDKMEMVNLPSAEARDEQYPNIVVEHKAKIFSKSDCFMMVESDPYQARLIHEYSRKPVLCPIEEKIYSTSIKS